MAPQPGRKVKPSQRAPTSPPTATNRKWAFALGLAAMDAVLVALIIAYVPYMKIDWDAYMSLVKGFLRGEMDYSNLKGNTGPLVYPAGLEEDLGRRGYQEMGKDLFGESKTRETGIWTCPTKSSLK